MERTKLLTAICAVIFIAGCQTTPDYVTDPAVDIGFISKEYTFSPCSELDQNVKFESFKDVIQQKSKETAQYLDCSIKVQKLQAVLKVLENGEIIRFTTP